MSDVGCRCIGCVDYGNRDSYDDVDRKLIADVERHGHSCLGIGQTSADDPPPYVFTAGMWHTHRQPELAVYGVGDLDAMMSILNGLADRARASGLPLRSGDRFPGLIGLRDVEPEDYWIKLMPIHPSWYASQFGTALFFNATNAVDFLQVVWPDGSGRYPDEPDFDAYFTDRQPLMWLPVVDHPPSVWVSDGMRATVPERRRDALESAIDGWDRADGAARTDAAAALAEAVDRALHWVYQEEARGRGRPIPPHLVYRLAKASVAWQDREPGAAAAEHDVAERLQASARRLLRWDDARRMTSKEIRDMGAWGTGVFDSDGAADWANAYDQTAPEERLAFIERTLAKAHSGSYLEVDDCVQVIAGAATVAALLPDTPTEPIAYGPETLWAESRFEVSGELRAAAIAALQRVIDPATEWSQLWDDAGRLDVVTAGVKRLIGALQPCADWAPHQELEQAASAYLRDPAMALGALHGLVEFDAVLGFTMHRSIKRRDWGDSLYQEITLTDGLRLVLWMGDDILDEDDSEVVLFESELRIIPLSWVHDVSLEVHHRPEPDGMSLHSVELRIYIAIPDNAVQKKKKKTAIFSDELDFSKTVNRHGHEQVSRLIEFGKVLARQVR
ncbi:hypothetical protein FHU31_000138 [Mycolicibacterium fluoranthenivorans]|uniref:DUF4262 domain-containing protein n=1 Tax=Mycolicibacterium fluoranthenivorans TaxID=258505 RepID=A0A7X5TV91_9MYCO|nr:DUF4262 domain-containing protein [Mycolicibacterium fluoranthenivorans]NIH93182.1 hypothetical protein [Mycolicibacterium fluoranthenivorans]